MLLAISLKQVILNMAYQHLFYYMAGQNLKHPSLDKLKIKLDKPLLESLFNCSNHLDLYPEDAEKLLGDKLCRFEGLKPLLKERCAHHDPLIAVRFMLLTDVREMNFGGDTEVQVERYYKTIKCLNQIHRELGMDCLELNRVIVAPDVINNDVP